MESLERWDIGFLDCVFRIRGILEQAESNAVGQVGILIYNLGELPFEVSSPGCVLGRYSRLLGSGGVAADRAIGHAFGQMYLS